MTITILGASGRTGKELVDQALAAGHSVHALIRSSDAAPANRPRLSIMVGDATNAKNVATASKGSDVVVSVLGGNESNLVTNTVKAALAASKAAPFKRFILMSSFLAHKNQLSSVTKLVSDTVLNKQVKDESKSEDLLRSSDLDWTIVYATRLTEDPKTGTVRVAASTETVGARDKIARADVAAWILNEAEHNNFVKKEALITA